MEATTDYYMLNESYNIDISQIKFFRGQMPSTYMFVSVAQQTLTLIEDRKQVYETKIATAKNGVGELNGSECTPRGWHIIRAKIGENCPENTVFRGRRPTGEIFSAKLKQHFPNRDWILTRIMWLSGLQPGFNRLGDRDTMRRYVYIHGCPDSDEMGIPSSHGCVKMTNRHVIELFERVKVYTPVYIHEG